MIRDIAGRQNHSIRLARKLLKKKQRRERGLLVCEGMDLLHAAVEAGAQIHEVLVRRDLLDALPAGLRQRAAGAGAEARGAAGRAARQNTTPTAALDIGLCDRETLEYASALGGGVDVIFICAEPAWSLADVAMAEALTFYLDGVGDPGNVGTVIRSALAFGAAGVVCSPGTADSYGPKAMRAGMGAQFLLPVVTEVPAADLKARFNAAAARGEVSPAVWVADPHGGDDLRSMPLVAGPLVILGAERAGPGTIWADARRVTIPQKGFESINVAMAGAIFAYEASRQALEGAGGARGAAPRRGAGLLGDGSGGLVDVPPGVRRRQVEQDTGGLGGPRVARSVAKDEAAR